MADDAAFDAAVKFVQRMQPGQSLSNDERLLMYGLYKQATVGPYAGASRARASFLDFKRSAMDKAWMARGSMPQALAKQLYVGHLKRLSRAFSASQQ